MRMLKGYFFLVTCVFSCFLQSQEAVENYEIYGPYLSEVVDAFKAYTWETYGFVAGSSRCMHEKIEDVWLSFDLNRRATLEEARALTVLLCEKFVEIMNTHEKIQPYLEVSPFTADRVQLNISFTDVTNRMLADGTPANILKLSEQACEENRNTILYSSYDPFIDYFVNLYREPYEEAVQLVKAHPIEHPEIHERTEKEKAIDKALLIIRRDMEKKYVIQPYSIGGNMTNKIESFGANIVVYKPATKDEARALLLKFTDEILAMLNSNKELKPYFSHYPLEPKDIRLKLEFCRPFTAYSYPNTISFEDISLDNEKVTFFKTGEIMANVHEDSVESYADALKANTANINLDKFKADSSIIKFWKRMFGD